MILVSEVLMKREQEFPLNMVLLNNLAVLMASVNYLRGRYNRPLMVSSGYRPDRYNTQAGGAKNSPHKTCEAIDILDYGDKVSVWIDDEEFMVGPFAAWCIENIIELKKAGLYMEHPAYTDGWTHLQTRKPRSGSRIFKP